MKILLAEYAMGTGMDGTFLIEGRSMLKTLVNSFARLGHEVTYLTSGPLLPKGNAISSNKKDFRNIIDEEAKKADAGLIIGPDEILSELTAIIEDNTLNLGSTPEAVALCADKVKCTETLLRHKIPAPRILEDPEDVECIVKPRFGSASENTYLTTNTEIPPGSIATEFINGEHLSVSLIAGERTLPLCANKQMIEFMDLNDPAGIRVEYKGNTVCFSPPYKEELFRTAVTASRVLGCRGYTGVDIVYNGTPYVVDVNPRPTTSIYGICKVIDIEIADLLLKNRSGRLPDSVGTVAECSFTKEDFK
ncbi:MAG: ATP-grasp domain-containing protein [Methanomethylovorans sp.]|uniref:ATP-grasp domain-containing protein n=1 Tax=Methanomethylovorans sp. TaxID=2758717 RepID=UPI000AB17011|nr:ATP-grasp domain-containing protein [Methanomethylovorans sp.]